MLPSTLLPVKIVPGQSCFVALPLSFHRFEPPQCLLLAPMGHAHDAEASATEPIYVGWGGAASTRHELEMPASLAEALGLRPPLHVRVHLTELPTATALWVQADSSSDWDDLQQHAEHLRDAVLLQVLAVRVGQRLPLWVNQSGCVWLRVQRAEPEAPAIRMAAGMDLIVAPPEGAAPASTAAGSVPSSSEPRAKARRLRIGRVEDAGVADEMTIGLSKQAMLTLGAHEGQIVHLWTGHRAALATAAERPSAKRRGCAPGYCFGFASELPLRLAPAAHAMLPRALRHMLGCESGSVISARPMPPLSGALDLPTRSLLRRKHVARLVLHPLHHAPGVSETAAEPPVDADLVAAACAGLIDWVRQRVEEASAADDALGSGGHELGGTGAEGRQARGGAERVRNPRNHARPLPALNPIQVWARAR